MRWDPRGRQPSPTAQPLVESRLALGLPAWQRRGSLVPGARLELVSPTVIGLAPLVIHVEADALQVVGPELSRQRLLLDRTPNGLGCVRVRVRCPACAATAYRLYRDGARFVCRACAGLVYRSQRRGRLDRALDCRDACQRRIEQEPQGRSAVRDRRLQDRLREAETRLWRTLLARIAGATGGH